MTFLEEVCALCEGRCCKRFPVYSFGKVNQFRMNEIHPWDGLSNPLVNIWLDHMGNDLDCYYHRIGGCVDAVKPDPCRLFVCTLFDNFLLGLDYRGWKGHTKKATLVLYKIMKYSREGRLVRNLRLKHYEVTC